MARIRTIKPEFFTSEQIADCSTNARLLFVGLWCFCDDWGVHPDSAKRIKMEVFPADAFSIEEVAGFVDELVEAELLIRYTVDGKGYLCVTGWSRHQKIDRPNEKNRHPSPTDQRTIDDDSTNDRRTIAPEGKGIEGKGKERGQRGSRLPTNWALDDEFRDEGRKVRDDVDLAMEAEKFRDYWTAQPGQKGVKVDWLATWRNWLRNSRSTKPNGRSPPERPLSMAEKMALAEKRQGNAA